MYNAFFGFRENPFSLSPDPAFLYRSKQHEDALANLVYGVRSRKGLIVLTGEMGTGKTTILECLADFLREHCTEFACVWNPRITVDELFETIAYGLNLRCTGNSKPEVLLGLQQMLIQNFEEERSAVLIIDEAHNLDWDVLEEIRLLGNLRGKLLQIVLAGQPEFDRWLESPDLRHVKQRIVLRSSLQPLTETETAEYIATRLERAGVPYQTVFPPDLVTQIHVRSQGIPRTINVICDNLLTIAFAMNRRVATMEMLSEVAEDMRLKWRPRRTRYSAQRGRQNGARLNRATPVQRSRRRAGVAGARRVNDFETRAAAQNRSPEFAGKPFEAVGPADPEPTRDIPQQSFEPPGIGMETAAPDGQMPLDSPEPRSAGNEAQFRAEPTSQTEIPVTAPATWDSTAPTSEIHEILPPRFQMISDRAGASFAPMAKIARWIGSTTAVSLIVTAGLSLLAFSSKPIARWLVSPSVVGEEIPPLPLRIVPAYYTPAARDAGFKEKVFVVVKVDRQGGVANVEFPTPTAFDLDARVREAVRLWRFTPAMRGGNTVEGRMLLQVPFL